MERIAAVRSYWEAVEARNWSKSWSFLHEDFQAVWPVTKESWTREEFMRVNQEYPGDWHIRIDRIEPIDMGALSVVYVTLGQKWFYAISFFEFRDGMFLRVTEYWADGAEPPERKYKDRE